MNDYFDFDSFTYFEETLKRQRATEVQTNAIYHAQNDAFFGGKYWNVRPMPLELKNSPMEFTKESAKKFVTKLAKSEFVRKNWGKVKPPEIYIGEFNPKNGEELEGAALYDPNFHMIAMAPNGFATSKGTLIHEFAHAVEKEAFGPQAWDKGHGERFARINIMLVEEFISKDTAKVLEEKIVEYGGKVASRESVLKEV